MSMISKTLARRLVHQESTSTRSGLRGDLQFDVRFKNLYLKIKNPYNWLVKIQAL